MVAAALADAGTADAGLPSSALNSLGPNGQRFAQNLEGGLMNGTLDSALSQAFGDHRVPSWKQIGIDAFGNALGNAAYQGLSHWQAASTTAGIPIGNADIRQQIAQDIGTPTVTVPNLVQNPSLDFSGFSAGTTTVGSAGAQGWWGVAQSVLGRNASDAAVERWVQAAISVNHGQTVLQQGAVVNLPGSDEIVTDAAKLSYDAANASYQAAQATANAQSEAALWGTIAGIGQEPSLQQTMDGAPIVQPAATGTIGPAPLTKPEAFYATSQALAHFADTTPALGFTPLGAGLKVLPGIENTLGNAWAALFPSNWGGGIRAATNPFTGNQFYGNAITNERFSMAGLLGGAVLTDGLAAEAAPLLEGVTSSATPFEQIMAKLQGMDFSTAPNTALFYSGIGTGDTARALAAERGLVTISNTEGGAYLESFGDLYGANSPVSRGEADQLWGFASQQYANGASGDVTAILNDPKSNRIYLSIEQKILQNNPNVKLTETQIMDWYAPAGNYH